MLELPIFATIKGAVQFRLRDNDVNVISGIGGSSTLDISYNKSFSYNYPNIRCAH